MTETIRTTGSALNDFFASIRNGWIGFRVASRHRAEERRRYPMIEYVTKRQYDAQVKGFWANIDGIRNGFHENRSRIEALEAKVFGREQKPFHPEPVERMWFCPNGHNAFSTTETFPECAACSTIMTTDQDAFEAACEASDILRYGPM